MNRNKVLTLLFFFLLISLRNQAQSSATISGTIDNAATTSVQLAIDRLYLNKKIENTTSTVNNGQFQFTANAEQGRIAEVFTENIHQKVFIEPGTNLQMQIKDNAISYSGMGAEQNIFLKSFYEKFASDFDDSLMQKQMLSTGVDAFEILAFDNRKKEMDFFKNDANKGKFSAGFTEFIQNTINYRYWNLLLSYPIINANRDSKILTVNELPKIMLEDLAQVKLSNDAAINSESYRQFLKYYVIYFTSERNGFQKFKDRSVSADRKFTFAKEKLNGSAYKFWMSQFMVEECARLSPFMIKKYIAEIKTLDKDGSYVAAVTEVCGERMAMKEEVANEENKKETKTTSEKTDPLDLTDLDGKHVSLNDFRGKVVYIDFWASWCGPCRGMMPKSKELHGQLTDKQKKKIIFLYISIDADAAAWKKAISDLGIEGTHVNSPGSWNAKAVSYFQINSIPRYMIMDKKGDIVDSNAPRPADATVLDKLLRLAEE